MTAGASTHGGHVPVLPPIDAPAPWTVEGLRDPLPWFTAMARDHPIAYDGHAEIWHVFGHAAVQSFLRTPVDWSLAKRLEKVPPEQRSVRLLTSDPPEHLELKGHFVHAYRPRRVASLEPLIREECRSLLRGCAERGRFDVMEDFAHRLTSHMICRIMGVPPEDSEAVMGAVTTTAYHGAIPEPGEPPHVYMGASHPDARKNSGYFADLVRARRADPRDDLVSDLAQVPAGDLIGTLEVSLLLNEQLDAGQSTTTHLIGSMLLALDASRDQWDLVRGDRGLVPSAVEEALRYSTPVQGRPRVSTHDLVLDGAEVPEGSVGVAWTQAANVDPAVFVDPLRFDVRRAPNPHVTFGTGEHFCLGSSLARMEAKIALEEWIDMFADYACVGDGPPRWRQDFIVRGLTELEVEVQPH